MTTKTKRKVRLFRYEITEVDWPKGEAPLTVGAVIIDKWNSDRCWEVHNFSKKDHYVGSWSAKLLGELTEEEYAQHEAQKAARAEGRMVPMPDLLRGVPRGGLRLAAALDKYANRDDPLLVVDDVLTTGASMERMRANSAMPDLAIGAVLFARGKCPEWVTPLFQMPFGGEPPMTEKGGTE